MAAWPVSRRSAHGRAPSYCLGPRAAYTGSMRFGRVCSAAEVPSGAWCTEVRASAGIVACVRVRTSVAAGGAGPTRVGEVAVGLTGAGSAPATSVIGATDVGTSEVWSSTPVRVQSRCVRACTPAQAHATPCHARPHVSSRARVFWLFPRSLVPGRPPVACLVRCAAPT